ncbi:hypothetical protein D5R81_03070 [Parashewanella spongiae]|uniref:YscQ/HrcQ family type III secretion apparatus protein n=1 Tax=Parashewanella spongiae TaxID=342950 RepID=A0A3A6TWV5_9GAMM|nr:hypothetical protein [Parashewanella spongiae]MCL1076951.1 hypothetical protein [Parashewanella spongiae]RJY18933.1 hypothetical protein D5R81_03070 [Parashewanella spongiae]
MDSRVIISASQAIGYGLEAQDCLFELKHIGGDGVFWQHQELPAGVGIWCPLSDWKKAILTYTGISILEQVPEDFLPCVTAAILEVAGDWLVEGVKETPENRTLENNIYPVFTLAGIRCVLIDWPMEQWKSMVAHWAPFTGESPEIELSLIAGYKNQTSKEPLLPNKGAGLWLDHSTDVEQGEAILWWQGPIAKVKINDELDAGHGEMIVEEVLPETDFHYPPLLAELAKVKLSLAEIGTMVTGDDITFTLIQNGKVSLCRQPNEVHQETVALVSLLKSPSGLLAKVESKEF